MSHKLDQIFSIYEKDFYKYLIPWVINELNLAMISIKDNPNLPIPHYFESLDDLNNVAKNIILNQVNNYIEYLFPSITFNNKKLFKDVKKHITYPNNTLQDIFIAVKFELSNDLPKNEIEQLRENILLTTINPIIEQKLKLKTHIRWLAFYSLKEVQRLNLPPDIVNKAYQKYQTKWEEKQKTQPKTRISRPRQQTAKDYILFQIIPNETDNNKILTKKELDNLTFKLRTNENLDSLYDFYLRQHHLHFISRIQQEDTEFNSQMNINDFRQKIGYKDKQKRALLERVNYGQSQPNPRPIKFPINHFPLKENKKRYCLHTIAPRYSYLIDLMFENQEYCYLVMININTRKLWVEQTNYPSELANLTFEQNIYYDKPKSSINIINALERIIENMKTQKTHIRYLSGDSEKGFLSETFNRFLEEHQIKPFIPIQRENLNSKYPDFMYKNNMVQKIINKTIPKHSSLGIIDRVIRTIRDIAYNMKIGIIDPKAMKNIVWQYNNAPHKTLTKYAGQPVSPNEADSDPDLEEFIVRQIQIENYNIMNEPTFYLKPGEKINIYNEKSKMLKRRSEIEPGDWRIKNCNGSLFTVINLDNNQEQIKSRYQIDKLYNY